MADKNIGDLTQAESIGNEDLFVLQQNGEAKKLKGEQLIGYVTMNVISVTVETLPAGSQATATYNRTTGALSLGIPQGEQGNIGPANTLTIGTVTSGIEASATITGEAPNQVLNLVLKQGDKGNPGDDAPTITGISIRQSDYHMIVTLSDGTSYDAGYCRGASGAGTGDMLASIYDPQGKTQDIFAYVDDALNGKQDAITGTQGQVVGFGADGKPLAQDAPSSLPAGGTAGQVLAKKGEADYDTEWKDVSADVLPVNVEILETICENIELTNSNPSYTFPTAITIDSDGLYYISYSYYKNDTFSLINSGYLFSKPETIDNVLSVRWLSSSATNSITMTAANIVDTWVGTSGKSIISIYKVNVTVNDEMKKAALLREGCINTASGNYSHAEGSKNTASGNYSHAEGDSNTASGNRSHVEGLKNTASGDASHAEGDTTTASGGGSHAEGYSNTASGVCSHAEGYHTEAFGYATHVQGKFNIIQSDVGADVYGPYCHIVGNGLSDTKRSNAHTLDWDGNAWFAGTLEGTALILKSSTSNSNKRFKITVDDSGNLTATAII